ncbi:unnamed protein product [Rhizoctonia solani]|uniref:Uncharacterized protein n=1 Tax=Rhizoctonia solani TaxID=456999 RepID=A0A8H3CIW3_9AGAM|nr:unnamed protein product [Rhizoctonia solani]
MRAPLGIFCRVLRPRLLKPVHVGVARCTTFTDHHEMSRMVFEFCNSGWDYLGKDKHAAHVTSLTLRFCTWTSCNTLSSSHSLWHLFYFFSCLVSHLRYLYENDPFCYRSFTNYFTIRTNFSHSLCLDSCDDALLRTHQRDEILATIAPNFFLCFVPKQAFATRSIRSKTCISTLFGVRSGYPKATSRSGHRTCQIAQSLVSTCPHAISILRQWAESMLYNRAVTCNFSMFPVGSPNSLCPICRTMPEPTFNPGGIFPSDSVLGVIPKSLCSAPSGTPNYNLKGIVKSAVSIATLCLYLAPANAAHLPKDDHIPSIVYILPQPYDANSRLDRRDTSTHDSRGARWKGMVIGASVGSTAGAVILGIGIYLLYRAHRKRRISPSESLPIEMQPARSPRPRPSNVTQVLHTRPPPRTQAQEAPGPPSSWASKAPQTPSLASLELQPRLLHPRDISRATHIRASTGSQFTEHFEPVIRAYRRLSGGISADRSQSPSITTHQFQEGTDPQGSSQHRDPNAPSTSTHEEASEQSEHTRRDSQMTVTLPPGAAAPVESVGNYIPPEATIAQNGRIQLS